jgi:outer membrane murein-binding lipoprotein Lpp
MKRSTAITSIVAGALLVGGCAAKQKTEPAATSDMNASSRGEERTTEAMPEAVPAYVNEVKSGAGQLEYSATEDGRLYLVDTNDNVVLYSGTISKGQAFALDPEARRATIDGKYVFTREINPNHSHKLYFTAE